MKTEFYLFVIIKFSQIEVSSSNYAEVNVDFKGNTKQSQYSINGTMSKGYNSYNNKCTFISPIYTFPWRET